MNSSKTEHARFLDKTNFIKFALAAILPFQLWFILIGLFPNVWFGLHVDCLYTVILHPGDQVMDGVRITKR